MIPIQAMNKFVSRLGLACALAAPGVRAAPAACDLLSAAQIRAVQGEAPQEAKAQSATSNGLAESQCYFTLPTPANSVSLSLTERGAGAGARSPRAWWKETFHHRHERGKEGAQRGEEEEDRKESPPQRVPGVGDEAYWAASAVGGSLYVLRGDRFIRLSVGGGGDAAQKLRRSRALARLALKRLR